MDFIFLFTCSSSLSLSFFFSHTIDLAYMSRSSIENSFLVGLFLFDLECLSILRADKDPALRVDSTFSSCSSFTLAAISYLSILRFYKTSLYLRSIGYILLLFQISRDLLLIAGLNSSSLKKELSLNSSSTITEGILLGECLKADKYLSDTPGL